MHDLLTKRKRELPVDKESITGRCVCKSVCVCVCVGVCGSVLCVWYVCGVVRVCKQKSANIVCPNYSIGWSVFGSLKSLVQVSG